MSQPTASQRAAILATGNVLLEAGAGSGKTSTLIERCIHQVLDSDTPCSVEEILMVTFTEAAAAEMRHRIRVGLNQRLRATPTHRRVAEQLALLDQAHIGTLHGFCSRLVRQHFHELGLDPQTRVIDESQARLVADEAMQAVFEHFYGAEDPGADQVRSLIRTYADGRDPLIADLVKTTHQLLATLPNRASWTKRERDYWTAFRRDVAERELADAVTSRAPCWLELLAAQDPENPAAETGTSLVSELSQPKERTRIADLLSAILALDNDRNFPRKTRGRFRTPLVPLFTEANFYAQLCVSTEGHIDPLEEDFIRVQPHALALLDLVDRFEQEFSTRKRQQNAMDFSDLEQFTLRLLVNEETGELTSVAEEWQRKIKQVCVDEYQDINEAQDQIIRALSRGDESGNRFLVGDVKQSIYGFRLARPEIFLGYSKQWGGEAAPGSVLPLSDNFRSHESIIEFVNAVFSRLMAQEIGGVRYGETSFLRFGAAESRHGVTRAADATPRVEFICRFSDGAPRTAEFTDSDNSEEELTNAELEATIALEQLVKLKTDGSTIYDRAINAQRPAEWRDMSILLRATSQKAEIYSRVFARAGVPLLANRRGFFDSSEITDLVSLLTLIDNPLQDIPLLAVLRSPIVGLSPDELVAVRLAAREERQFWTALQRFRQPADSTEGDARNGTVQRVDEFLNRFERWRTAARRQPLSQCVEEILEDTRYVAWLTAQPNGDAAKQNLQRLLELIRDYDSWQARGLHRFLEYVRLVQAEGDGPEPATAAHENAVQLLTIHASKGLEFPIVVLADLGKRFNRDRPTAGVLINEQLGICPTVRVPEKSLAYPSLRLKRAELAQQEQSIAEELRLLYVALTRACDHLILLGTTSSARAQKQWAIEHQPTLTQQQVLSSSSMLDFLGPLLSGLSGRHDWFEFSEGETGLLRWQTIRPDDPAKEIPLATPEPDRNHGDRSSLSSIRERIEFRYPFLDATRRHGKTTVTRLRKQLAMEEDDEAGSLFGDPGTVRSDWRASGRRKRSGGLSAAETGIAYHTFFQNVRLDQTGSLDALNQELDRLRSGRRLSDEQADAIELNKVLEFWRSDVGRGFLRHPDRIRREFPFTAAFTQSELARFGNVETDHNIADDVVIVQGIADLVLILPREIWILDFKSDDVTARNLNERVTAYRPQVQLYQQALEKVCHKPVSRLWLHFLHPGRSVEVGLAKSKP